MKGIVKTNNSPSTTGNPAGLLAMAVEKGLPLEQMKELMDLQERWERKEAKKAFFDALSKFQTMVPSIKKNRTARINSQKGNYSYKFADLGNIGAQIKKALHECGLSYRWEFKDNGTMMKVTCILSHRDGHSETTEMEAGLDNSGYKNDIQQKGSSHTYLQRYTLIGALGLTTADEDNDAIGHQTTVNPEVKVELSEEEVLDQWKQTVAGVKTKIELSSLYLKNKKAVDGNPAVQAVFKAKEAELKTSQPKPQTVELP